jgi:hypothetical protein
MAGDMGDKTMNVVLRGYIFALAVSLSGLAHASPTEVFALIVTNNRSTGLSRPDLQYADDDGVRYYNLFRGVAGEKNVQLLTRLDRATLAAYPEMISQVVAPRRTELLAALAALQTQVAERRAAGKATRFYFVYAGHGDVENGTGYLDLEDGRIDSAFLETEVVGKVAADEQHILLDSCNSFFVVNPRKPGGRRWATPKDMALGFASRHPNVGLFLSTNSEAEVYEWSEVESGIFSHEVRSGLSGAADVNGDGQVSYVELGGFVDRANQRLPRANLRPQIYYRGPAGDSASALFDTRTANGRRVVLGTPARRLWVRGPAGERIIDLNKEDGRMTLVVPGPSEQALSIVEWQESLTANMPPSVREFSIPSGNEQISLADLQPEAAQSRARGGAALFGQLFALPYGAQSFASYQAAGQTDEPIYGIGTAEEARMRHYLNTIAASDSTYRNNNGYVLGGLGLMATSASVSLALSQPRWGGEYRNYTLGLGAAGLGIMGLGLYLTQSKSLGQIAQETFDTEIRAAPENPALAVAKTELFLDDLATRERRTRKLIVGIFGATASIMAIAATTRLVLGHVDRDQPTSLVFSYAFALYMGINAWRLAITDLPTERLLRMYRTDPDLKVLVAPIPVAGRIGMGLSLQF